MSLTIKTFNSLLAFFLTGCSIGYYWARFIFCDRLLFRTKVHSFKNQKKNRKILAIIAFHPKGNHISKNMIDAISILRNFNTQIILVSNGDLLEDSIPYLSKISDVVIKQSNCGRDFGAFKTGFEYFHQQPSSDIDKIIFMNDSILIFPDKFKRIIERVYLSDGNFLGATESYERLFHVSSYFFCVSKKIFQSPWFIDFWTNYKRISSRKHAILSGEIKLSKMMIDQGYLPTVLFSSARIGEKILEILKKSHIFNLRDINVMSLRFDNPEEKTKRNLFSEISIGETGFNVSEFFTTLSRESNIHRFNLFMITYMDFPFLKRDLVKRGVVEPVELELFLKTRLDIDQQDLVQIVKTRNTIRYAKGIKKLLMKYGII